MTIQHRRRRTTVGVLTALAATAALTTVAGQAAPLPSAAAGPVVAEEPASVPEVLQGDTWLRHHAEDLMPYWDMPEALGDPVGNFPSFRGRSGEVLPESTTRGVSTLARQVYGYTLAFHLTGEERYLTYARAGLDWISTHAKDTEHGGWFDQLDEDGHPVDPQGDKSVFTVGSLGLAYGMYFEVTRDPEAERELLGLRDLLFGPYYGPAQNRVKDALTYDLSAEVDVPRNGSDITNVLVPATSIYLPHTAALSDPDRRAQFTEDLRKLGQSLVTRHRSTTDAPTWWFWGRSLRHGNLAAPQTDFGHNIKSYEMLLNADRMFPDRPWAGLAADRTALLEAAWDDEASRWNDDLVSLDPWTVARDSGWWIHAEADQTLASLDLDEDFAHQQRLARSAQTWLDVYVDRDPAYPAREVFTRVTRDPAGDDLRKSFFGKNMLHAHERALVMYLHGRALEGRPARLHYALPEDQTLTAVAEPYWFDAAGQRRVVGDALGVLPGHRRVDVDFTGLDAVVPVPYPAPDDSAPPEVSADVAGGWYGAPLTVTVTATDTGVGVRDVRATVEDLTGVHAGTGFIEPGGQLVLPALEPDGDYRVTLTATDLLGQTSQPQVLRIVVDATAPTLSGLPPQPCRVWPPNERMVQVADVVGSDALAGVASLQVTAVSSEPSTTPGVADVRVEGGRVWVRASRYDEGPGRTYTMTATVTDRAGNSTTGVATCLVPHDVRPAG